MHVSLDIAAAVVDGICMSHGQKSIETHSSDTSRQIGFRFKGKRKKRVDSNKTNSHSDIEKNVEPAIKGA